jgi:hypothetical protein
MRNPIGPRSRLVIGGACVATLIALSAAADPSDYLGQRGRHRVLSGDFPPGALGQARLAGRGPVACYFQPVLVSGPPSAQFSLPSGGAFLEPSPTLSAGLMIGGVYRFRITSIPGAEGAELYPTLEVIDRTYPPPGLATHYPIQIQLDQDDFDAALDDRMVTRVIYLEDPQTATPLVQTAESNRPLEIAEYQDALEVADRLGRPVAILRIGSVAPPQVEDLMPQFFFGYPTWIPIEQPQRATAP